MAALNTNINDDLVFSGVYNRIRRTDANQALFIHSAAIAAGSGSYIRLASLGDAQAGQVAIYCPSAGTDNFIASFVNAEIRFARSLNMWNERITLIGQATTDMDAVPQTKMWGTWTPTLVWGTATPGGLATIARYCQIGKTVYFDLFLSSADSNACSSLTATLPVAPKNNSALTSFSGMQFRGGVGVTHPIPYNSQGDSLIIFGNFLAGTDAQVIQVNVAGFYEVA
jgi:hypothetical protein